MRPLDRRRTVKVLTIFALGVILPSAFLSYLGFRSFQYEGMLIRSQTEERHAAAADLMQREAGEIFAAAVHRLEETIRSEPFQTGEGWDATRQILALEDLGGSRLKGFFIFDARGPRAILRSSSRLTRRLPSILPPSSCD